MRWHWQYPVFLLSVGLNVDWLIPILLRRDLSRWQVFFVASLIGTVEIFIWYQFWKFFRKMVVPELIQKLARNKHVKEAIELGRNIHWRLKEVGLWDKIIYFLYRKYRWFADDNNPTVRRIKRWGYPAMLMLGVEPFVWGGRVTGVIFCAPISWRRGLYTLAVGNIIRIAYMIGLWSFVFHLFKK